MNIEKIATVVFAVEGAVMVTAPQSAHETELAGGARATRFLRCWTRKNGAPPLANLRGRCGRRSWGRTRRVQRAVALVEAALQAVSVRGRQPGASRPPLRPAAAS